MDFEFEPRRAKRLARHLRGKHGLFGIAHAARVGQQLNFGTHHVREHIVVAVAQFYPLHRHCHHLGARGGNGGLHLGIAAKLARTEKQAGLECPSCND